MRTTYTRPPLSQVRNLKVGTRVLGLPIVKGMQPKAGEIVQVNELYLSDPSQTWMYLIRWQDGTPRVVSAEAFRRPETSYVMLAA